MERLFIFEAYKEKLAGPKNIAGAFWDRTVTGIEKQYC